MPIFSHNLTSTFNKFPLSDSNVQFPFPISKKFPTSFPIVCAKRGKRTGKLRYPSEKKKLRLKQQTHTDVDRKLEAVWRISGLGVPVYEDPGKDFWGVSEALLKEIAKVLEFPVASMLPPEAFTVVRKSFDARKLQQEPKFVHTVDMDVRKLLNLEPRTQEFISELEPKVGCLELLHNDKVSGDLMSIISSHQRINDSESSRRDAQGNRVVGASATGKPKVLVVGCGPSGLFASLVLAEVGADVTLLERGQAVEQRGRDIGALVVRRMLKLESNFCFGEGGAGTWSDGKLVTRIGRNNSSVLTVLKTLVHFGAPYSILVDGKPHLGTDRLIPLLRNFRHHLLDLGVTIKFGTRVDDLLVKDDRVFGVKTSDSIGSFETSCEMVGFDAVVLAVGHSARDTYQMLLSHNVDMVQKDFAVGLRIEHPQELINNIQYSKLASEVKNGRGKVPVADYQIAEYVNQKAMGTPSSSDTINRSCYSFCMCPGGQVVLTSTDPSELCINGMSFSRRSSRWANAALVVTVSSNDFDELNSYGPLAGVQFQRTLERKAAEMGGGNFVVPVQTAPDFLDSKLSATTIPPSSYRLGIKPAYLHNLFPIHITEALQRAMSMFDKETRTSSAVQISRRSETWESTSLKGLYPVGEGAGYAGGIVSAAVDGMQAGFAVARNLGLFNDNTGSLFGKVQNVGVVKY